MLTCVCVACGTEAPKPAYLLWRIDGPRCHVYLLGSVHVLRASDRLESPAIERAYTAARRPVMELDFDAFDAQACGEVMASKATDSGGLVDVLGEDGYASAVEQASQL